MLDARLRQSLATVRSLGQRGLSVAAIDTVTSVPAFASRWCRYGGTYPTDLGVDAYIAHLDDVLRRGVGVLISSHDATIAVLRRHRTQIERRARVALADEQALAIAVNKQRTLAVARDLRLSIPDSIPVCSLRDVADAIAQIGLPAVVKPTESWLWADGRGRRVASCVVATADEARTAVADLTEAGGTTLLQPLLTGRREAVSMLYANGEVFARFAHWERRTNPPLGGEGVLRQSIAVPADVGAQADRLVRELDLEGYSQVEFRRDAEGRPYLMEINSRLTASVELAVRSGVDFPYLLYCWASGAPIEKVEGYRAGRWMRYLAGDLEATIATVQQRRRPGTSSPLRAVLEFGRSFLRPMAYDGVDWRDPLPTINAAADCTRYLMDRAIRRTANVFRRPIE